MSRKIFLTAFFVCVFSQSVLSAEDLPEYKDAAIRTIITQFNKVVSDGSTTDRNVKRKEEMMTDFIENKIKYGLYLLKTTDDEMGEETVSAKDRARIWSSKDDVIACVFRESAAANESLYRLYTTEVRTPQHDTTGLYRSKFSKVIEDWARELLTYKERFDMSIAAVKLTTVKTQVDKIVSEFSMLTAKVGQFTEAVIPEVVFLQKNWEMDMQNYIMRFRIKTEHELGYLRGKLNLCFEQ